jgi:formyl-CoA transferase
MSPFHIDGVEKVPAVRAPSVGQHNEAVLLEAGYSAADVARLRGLGVVA